VIKTVAAMQRNRGAAEIMRKSGRFAHFLHKMSLLIKSWANAKGELNVNNTSTPSARRGIVPQKPKPGRVEHE
jgi:hypothetical protein